MKKILSFGLTLLFVLASITTAFAAAPSDVTGTPYEQAVRSLVDQGIVKGYSDGSFRPDSTITRAEAAIIVVKSLGVKEEVLSASNTQSSAFSDLAGFDWAKPYINYAASKGILSGYSDGTFRPGATVTYNEMATMLVRALGYQAAELPGVWPSNFVNKAKALGVFDGIAFDGMKGATRGHVAMMDYSVMEELAKAGQGGSTENGTSEPQNLAGKLANYSGRAFGIILDKASVLNADGDVVEQVEFLFADDVLYLNTNGKFTVDVTNLSTDLHEGNLFGLKMSQGIVQATASGDLTASFSAIGTLSTFESHTNGWSLVQDFGNDVVKVNDQYYSIIDNASVYVATIENNVITGYTAGSMSDIDEGVSVRLYTITGDNPGVVEVVLVAKELRLR